MHWLIPFDPLEIHRNKKLVKLKGQKDPRRKKTDNSQLLDKIKTLPEDETCSFPGHKNVSLGFMVNIKILKGYFHYCIGIGLGNKILNN